MHHARRPLPSRRSSVRSPLTKPWIALLTVAWALMLVTRSFLDVGEALVALAVACVVPLGVALAADRDVAGAHRPSFRAVALCLSVSALLGLTSFLLPPGPVAGACACAWVVASTRAAARRHRRGLRPVCGPDGARPRGLGRNSKTALKPPSVTESPPPGSALPRSPLPRSPLPRKGNGTGSLSLQPFGREYRSGSPPRTRDPRSRPRAPSCALRTRCIA